MQWRWVNAPGPRHTGAPGMGDDSNRLLAANLGRDLFNESGISSRHFFGGQLVPIVGRGGGDAPSWKIDERDRVGQWRMNWEKVMRIRCREDIKSTASFLLFHPVPPVPCCRFLRFLLQNNAEYRYAHPCPFRGRHMA